MQGCPPPSALLMVQALGAQGLRLDSSGKRCEQGVMRLGLGMRLKLGWGWGRGRGSG